MLDKQKISEAETNVRYYLEKGLLKRKSNATAQMMFLENSLLSLKTAEKLLKLEAEDYKPYLWILVCSYYSMFYISNAVLLKIGYKVGDKISHKITEDALIVFVRNKLKKELLEDYHDTQEAAMELISHKVDELIKDFSRERGKRGYFQYEMDEQLKKDKALTSFNRARKFIFEMKKLL